ncbi:DUF5979 domain-containing protein [Cellulomonas composti]|uniref:Uncharacterized protein n=1 Tax=Cellulomonas composti TaxID=266130 RepID=A0A511JBF4_9CELL|nr:DUF5979 domain-containing protein [Cellulomonas composti]GEL95321.1 hypothetical protein CCO02nite_19790 [Cellulomonas composti]
MSTRHRPAPRLVAGLTALAIAATGSVVALAASSASAASSTVSGRVYRDFNGNGAYDTTTGLGRSIDAGLTGLDVVVTDRAGASVTTTTGASGLWSANVSTLAGSRLRVQFETPDGMAATAAGADNGTSVQFVDDGATGVDYAVNVPADHVQTNPPVVVTIQTAGSRSNAATTGTAAVAATPWDVARNDSGANNTTRFSARTTIATYGQVGSVWSSVYSSRSDELWVSATYKRESDLGPAGIGGIYHFADVTSDSGAVHASPAMTWLDVRTLVDQDGQPIDVGTVPTRTLGAPSVTNPDTDAFAQAARVGIGGMALDPTGTVLLFVNLRDRNLYAIDLTQPVITEATRIDLGLAATRQPWALTIRDGSLYVGTVDTGTTAGQSAAAAGLRAYVLRAPVLDALAGTATWTSIVRSAGVDGVDLGYTRGNPISAWSGTDYSGTYPQIIRWNTWTNTWKWGTTGTVSFAAGSSWGPVHVYPQAVLTDLTFDEDGFLVLSFADRTAIQGGNRNVAADTSVTGTWESISSGDTLIAGPNAARTVYTLENNGSVTGVNHLGAAVTRTGSGSANEGPGGREFFADQQNLNTGTTHREITLGSAVSFPGSTQAIVSSSFDPLSGIRLAGLTWFSATNGSATRGYEHTLDLWDTGDSSSFQKGGGLGAIEALAETAPVEIGNRVWFDADQDGLQDADEPGVAGVTVELRDGATLVATTTTNAAGEYYFRSDDATHPFDPFGTYDVVVVPPTSGNWLTGDPTFGTVPWSWLRFTDQDAGDDDLDSDVDPTTGAVTYTVGGPGVNDHSIDAGLVADVAFTVEKRIDASGGASASGATYAMAVAARDFRGVALTLPAGDAAFAVTVGAGNGHTVTVPVGTRATVTETSTAGQRSAPVVSPAGEFLVTGSTATPQLVTVTNTLRAPGRFSVAKTVTGGGAALVGASQSFTIEYSSDAGGSWQSLTVDRGSSATSPDLPYGTTVLIREATRPSVTGVVWGTPVWTIGAAEPVTQAQVSITIGDATTVAIALENPTTRTTAGLSLTKSVTGGAAASVPNGFHFLVDATWTNPVTALPGSAVLDLTKSAPTDSLAGLPYGTVVTLAERARTGAPADVQWGTPVWSGTGVTTNGDGSASVTIGTSTVTVGLENPTTQLVGGFSVTKRVTDAASASAPATGYTFRYSYGATTGSGSVDVDDTTSVSGIPAGTTVTLWEDAPPAGGPDLAWETPVWSGTGVTDNGDGTATLVVTAGSTAALTLTNPTTQLVDGFSITKSVTGGASASVPPTFEFEVDYDLDGVPQTPITLTKADPSASFSGLPRGTVVTLREVAPTGAPADVAWQTPVWSGAGVTTDDDGSATFTIGSSPVAVSLENPTERLYGSFAITKDVTGEGEHLLVGDPGFQVTYTPEGGLPTTVTVHHGERWELDGHLPAGTVVTFVEATPLDGLPDGASWRTPRFLVDGTPVDEITIGDGSTIEVVLENPTAVTPRIDIEKGDGAAGVITHDADTMDDGELYAPGETRDVVLVVTNTGTERLREVTLRDESVSGGDITAITWTFPDDTTAVATRDGDAWVARWADTFGQGSASFAPGAVITGVATLTVTASDAPHVDRASVSGVGIASGTTVSDEDAYNAFTGAIQVIKYDGEQDDPVVRADGAWSVPVKPLVSADQDANDAAHAVKATSEVARSVRWVVTNTGTTTLSDVTVADRTHVGPTITDISCDLSPFGGSTAYSFETSGAWHGLFPPSASFFCGGTLVLTATDAPVDHADTVAVEATVVVPEVDGDGVPTGEPRLVDGEPDLATHDDGTPYRVGDDDPYHATVPALTTPDPDPTDGPTPTPAPTSTPGDDLATTGADIAAAGGLAGLVLLLGAGLVLGARSARRRATPTGPLD